MLNHCECQVAGFCQRHKRDKTAEQVLVCQTDAHYRSLWDRQAESGERAVCKDWEKIDDGRFRCPTCLREYSSMPSDRPCVPPSGAARVCTEWEGVGAGAFKCLRCGRTAVAHNAAALPTSRRCVIPAPASEIGAPKGGCDTCGGGVKTTVANSTPAKPLAIIAPELPPLSERLRNLAVAIGDFAKDPGFCSPKEAHARLATCDSCDKLNGHFCSVCGCWLATATKLKSKHCPLGKWPGDNKGWTPHVHDNWLKQTLAVVIHYGDAKLTRDCVRDCLKEPVRVVVIDNQGDYAAVAKEEVLRTGSNLGWGKACNLGLKKFLADEKLQGVVLLNNDIRLSPGFFSGLIVAQRVTGAEMVAPCYNVGWGGQKTSDGYSREAEKYNPRPVHKLMGYCDGTAVLLTREIIEQCGELDVSMSPKHGWGLMSDYAIRAKEHGRTVAVTEAAYVYHHSMKAAEKEFGSVEAYVAGAKQELEVGARKKYGGEWQRKLNAVSINREIKTLNLIYHVWPVSSNGRWRWNVEQLLKRIEIFNGKKVVAIATGPNTSPVKEVKAAFSGHDVTFIEKENSAKFREANTFLELLDKVQTYDVTQATFYAHCKGVSRPDNNAETHWADLMYSELLDDPQRVREALAKKAMLGVSFEFDTPWIFPGTFWWFHNASLFSKPNWRHLDNPITHEGVGWSVEAFPNRFFADDCERIYPNLVYPSKNVRDIYDERWWLIQPHNWEYASLSAALDDFDETAYLSKNQDVAADVQRGIWKCGKDHYVSHGHQEGRRPC